MTPAQHAFDAAYATARSNWQALLLIPTQRQSNASYSLTCKGASHFTVWAMGHSSEKGEGLLT